MANRSQVGPVLAIGAFTLLTAVSGLYLGFVSPRQAAHTRPAPVQPDQGPILYDMHSMVSDPGRVRLDWRDVPGATGYRITVMTAADDSLFASPTLRTNSWVVPRDLKHLMKPHTVYHWKVTVTRTDGSESSEPSAFATQ